MGLGKEADLSRRGATGTGSVSARAGLGLLGGRRGPRRNKTRRQSLCLLLQFPSNFLPSSNCPFYSKKMSFRKTHGEVDAFVLLCGFFFSRN